MFFKKLVLNARIRAFWYTNIINDSKIMPLKNCLNITFNVQLNGSIFKLLYNMVIQIHYIKTPLFDNQF